MHPAHPSSPALQHLHSSGRTLLTIAGLLIAGLALGAIVAVLLRRRGLAWSWALPALLPLGPVILAADLGLSSAVVAPTVALCLGAATAAIGWGLHAHLEDLRIGGDRESTARERRGVSEHWRARRGERKGKRPALLADGVPVGAPRRASWPASRAATRAPAGTSSCRVRPGRVRRRRSRRSSSIT